MEGFDFGEISELLSLINSFTRVVNLSVSIQTIDHSVQLFTTYGGFLKITTSATDCALIRYLQSNVSFGLKNRLGSRTGIHSGKRKRRAGYASGESISGQLQFFRER